MSGNPGRLTGGRIGAFKTPKRTQATADDAEALAASVLNVLAADPALLGRFLADSGMSPADLAHAAGERSTLIAVLEHVSADESLLLVVAAQLNLAPDTLAGAIAALQTPAEQSP